MQFNTASSFIQMSAPRAGRSLPGVKFVPAGSAPPQRPARPLVSYASAEGTAWFETVMTELPEPPAAADAAASRTR